MKILTNEKLETISVIIAAILIVGGFFFVRSALNDDEVKVLEKQQNEKGFDEKPVVVYLQIHTDPTDTYKSIKIRKRMKNTNTVSELLESAREEDGLKFEKFAYTYGTELDNINGVKAPEGYKWYVMRSGPESEIQEITFEIGSTKLVDEATYVLMLASHPPIATAKE